MKNAFYLFVFFLLTFLACTKEKEVNQGFTYSDFEKNLKSDMNYNSIVAKFGEPVKDIGSGIHVYVYQLIDFSEIWIGYSDKIIYAKHMDKTIISEIHLLEMMIIGLILSILKIT